MALPDTIFQGGQMTDLPLYVGTIDGTEIMEIVAPGNADTGLNYRLTLLQLGLLINGLLNKPTEIKTGATVGNPYVAGPSDFRVLLNKDVASASYVNIGGGADRSNFPIMVRDIKGDAQTDPITVSFTGTCDGIVSPIVINSAYAGYIFNPLPNGNWYLSNA